MADDDNDDDEKLFLRPLDAVARGQKCTFGPTIVKNRRTSFMDDPLQSRQLYLKIDLI